MMEQIFAFWAEHFDLPILDWIAAHLRCGFLDAVMPVITVLGNGGMVWIAAALCLLLIPRYRKTGAAMAAALLMGLLVCNVAMKPLFARIRPYDYQLEYFGRTVELLIEAQHDYSFPSGHTIASFEAATVLTVYDRKLGIPALLLASLIAFSRLYLYVHYPTDVLCSVILGIGIGLLGCRIMEGFEKRRKEHA